MRNTSRRALPLLLLLSLLCALMAPVASADLQVHRYDYPVTADSPEWRGFATKKQMVDACRIPADVLHRMTTGALVAAICEYPTLIDVYAYNGPQTAKKLFLEQSDAYRELMSRRDGGSALLERSLQADTNAKDPGYEAIVRRSLFTLLVISDELTAGLSAAEKKALRQAAPELCLFQYRIRLSLPAADAEPSQAVPFAKGR